MTRRARRGEPVPGRPAGRLRRTLRRLVRWGLWSALALVVLLVLAWVFRREVVAPLLVPELEAALQQALQADRVAIGALDDDWLTGIEVRGLEIEGGRSVVQELRAGRVLADYSLLALLGGDVQGLLRADVRAERAVLDLRPRGAPTEAAPGGPFDPAALEPFVAVARAGASVRIGELVLLAPHGERTGELVVTLPPGAGERELAVRYDGVEVDARIATRAAAGGRVTATVAVDDPGALLDLFAAGAGVRGGTLRADVELALEPFVVAGRIDLVDLVHRGRQLQRTHVEARLDRDRLAIERATIDLPGLAAEVHELALPSPFGGGGLRLDALAGRFAVRIDDLAPHTAVLPAPLRALLPIEGRLAGAFADGRLRLEASELRARGAVLSLSRGAFPLASRDWRAATGSLEFALALDGFAVPVADLGATCNGRIAGTLTGSMAAPVLDVALALGACTAVPLSFTAATGRLRYDDGALAVEALRLQALDLAALAPGALPGALQVEVDAAARLRDGALDPDSLAVRATVAGPLPQQVAAALGDSALPAPVGFELRLEAQQGQGGVAVETLRVRTETGAPLSVAVDGSGTVPLRWDGSTLQPLDDGTLALRLQAAATDGDATVPSLDATLRLGPHAATVRLGEVAAGPLQVEGELATGFGLTELLQGSVSLATAPVTARLELAAVDLSALPAAWTGGFAFGGSLTGHVHADGPAGGLAPDVQLRWRDGSLRAPGFAALDDVQLGVELGADEAAAEGAAAGADAPAVTRLRAQLTGTFVEDLGLGRDLAVDVTARSADDGTRLLPSSVRIGDSSVQLELRSDLRRVDLLAGAIDPAATLAGTVTLDAFALERLPRAVHGLDALQGVANGRIEVDGTLATLGPELVRRATLSLRDGTVKAPNVPRIERLEAELDYAPGALRLASASGMLGAGTFTASGSLAGDDLIGDPDAAALDLRLDGQDLLLYRGDGAKVRATVALAVTGTAREALVGGRIELGRGSKYVRRISILPDLSARGGEAVNEGLQLVELPPALGQRLSFDVAITTAEPFEVRTSVFDGEVDVAAALRGGGIAPRIEGTMSLRSGVLRFPGATLRVVTGQLTFTRSEPRFPDLNVVAEGKRMGFVVTMAISGRYDQPLVQLSSVPPLPPQDLIVLLTTGQLPTTLVERGAEGQARFVGGYLAKEVLETWFGSESTERGESMLDRLTIETGREVSQNGAESVLVEYELEPNVALQVERDQYEDYNLGLVLRFRFR